MMRPLALALLLAASPAWAADVFFDLSDFMTGAISNKAVQVTPLSTPATNGTAVVVSDRLNFRTDASGQFWASNVVAGTYRVEVLGQAKTPFQITITEALATNTLNAADIVSTEILAANAAAGWTQTQADARYLGGVAAGTNVVFTTNGTPAVVTISSTGGGSGTNVWAGDTDAIYPEVAGNITYGTSISFSDYTTNRAIDLTALTNVWEDIVFPVQTFNPPGAESAGTLVITNGPSGEHYALVLGANNTVYLDFQMPHTWIAGTTVKPHFHVEPQSANSITCVWRVAYSVADIGSAFAASTVVTNTNTIAADSQYVHTLVNMPTDGISMADTTGPSTIGKLKYTLLSASEPIHVLSYDIHYRYGGTPVVYEP